MKNIFSLIGAGLVGGLIVVGAMKLTNNNVNVAPRNNYTKLASETTTVGGVVDLSQAAQSATPSVVYIEASESAQTANRRSQQDPFLGFFGFRQGPKKGTGSGVIVSKDGYIVTNNHVVDFADEVKVTLPAPDNRVFTAKVVGTDAQSDLAVLKISGSDFPAIQKGSSDNMKIGEWVLAIGNPYDIGTTVTAGIISAKDRKIREDSPLQDFIQTDAVVNPGNSGGALVDAQGRLIGINTAIQTHTGSYEGYSFAIPITIMNKVTEDIIKNGGSRPQAQNNNRNNLVPNGNRPRLGIEMVPDQYFKEEVENKDLNVEAGVLVADVKDGGAAQYAGILPNDVIVKINGSAIRSVNELRNIVSSAKAGDVLKVTVFRDGRTKEISVALKA
jgi:S1-C subfamily serine protease